MIFGGGDSSSETRELQKLQNQIKEMAEAASGPSVGSREYWHQELRRIDRDLVEANKELVLTSEIKSLQAKLAAAEAELNVQASRRPSGNRNNNNNRGSLADKSHDFLRRARNL